MATVLLGVITVLIALAVADVWSAFGESPKGERLERLKKSPQWHNGRFANPLPVVERTNPVAVFVKFIFGSRKHRIPQEPVSLVRRTAGDFAEMPDDMRITWFGHSSFLVELDGTRVLVDPVWGERASPMSFYGPKRFYEPPIQLDELPEIDAVVLSHDHYDHLNEETIKALRSRVSLFIAPIGVGAHLEYWGVDRARIAETDWWDSVNVGSVQLVCTPARHFSGRSFATRNKTLWAGWAILGSERRIYYSGDSGYFRELKDIGDRLGPFDITLIETGAYNQDWPDVHFGPEYAIQAHLDVRGGVFVPVHWGLFDLSFHAWTEPVERVLAAAEKAGVDVTVPRPGMSVMLPPDEVERWWPDLPWRTVEEYPIVPSGM